MLNTDLTTVAAVKEWMGTSASSSADAVVARTISGVSGQIRAYLSRSNLLSRSVIEFRNGTGTTGLMLREWPVTSVESVVVSGQTVSMVSGGDITEDFGPELSGWTIPPWDGTPPGEPCVLQLSGGSTFTQGINNVRVQYTAGYAVLNEAAQVPSSSSYVVSVQAPWGPWFGDIGVSYTSTGLPLTLVASNPGAGEYALGSVDGDYEFSSADAGEYILISYSYVPAAIFQAATEVTSERLVYRTRIGLLSKSLGGQESMSYDTSGLPDYARSMIDPFKSVLIL